VWLSRDSKRFGVKWDAHVEGGVSLFGQLLVELVLPLLFD